MFSAEHTIQGFDDELHAAMEAEAIVPAGTVARPNGESASL